MTPSQRHSATTHPPSHIGFDIDAFDPSKPEKQGPSLRPPPSNPRAYNTIHTSPTPASPTNILLQPFPAPVEGKTITNIYATLYSLSIAVGGGLALLWFLVAFRSGFWAFVIRTTVIGSIGVGTFLSTGILAKKVEKELEQVRLQASGRHRVAPGAGNS